MTQFCSTSKLVGNLVDNCLGLKKPGGVYGEIYFGHRPQVNTLVLGTNKEITALTLKAGEKLVRYVGKKFEHANDGKLVVQDPVNMFEHGGVYKFYPFTAAERLKFEELCKAERMFSILLTEAGQVIVDGLDINPYNPGDFDDDRGLKPVDGSWSQGVQFTENTPMQITLRGNFFNMPLIYKPAQTLAVNKAELDALCV